MELKNFDFRQKLMFHPEHLIALRNGERPFPITCEIDLTNLCNHDCYFCVVKEMREEHKTSLEKLYCAYGTELIITRKIFSKLCCA